MLFIHLDIHWENAIPTVRKKTMSYVGHNITNLSMRFIQNYQIVAPYANI